MEELIPADKRPFKALGKDRKEGPVIAVDMGYSKSNKSCGIAPCKDKDDPNYKFGQAIDETVELLKDSESADTVLVLEAPLSTYHDNDSGNPDRRGEFENGRGWYYGAGSITALAARRFLLKVAERLPENREVALAEAFLSNKEEKTEHYEDSEKICSEFWDIKPETLPADAEPLLPIIDGIPAVKVFEPEGSPDE